MTRLEYRDYFWSLFNEPQGENTAFLTPTYLNLLIKAGRQRYWRTMVQADTDGNFVPIIKVLKHLRFADNQLDDELWRDYAHFELVVE